MIFSVKQRLLVDCVDDAGQYAHFPFVVGNVATELEALRAVLAEVRGKALHPYAVYAFAPTRDTAEAARFLDANFTEPTERARLIWCDGARFAAAVRDDARRFRSKSEA